MTREALYKRYPKSEPVGSYIICSVFGLVVWKADELDRHSCDFVCAWVYNDGNMWGFHRHKLHTSQSGREYIRKGNSRFYLDEIMKGGNEWNA